MVSLIIPFRNEKESLPTLFADCSATLKNAGVDFEMIFIDDHSGDGGTEAVQALAGAHARVTLLQNKFGHGKGGALRTGIEAARGDILVFIDADLQNNPADIVRFLTALDAGNDLVNGFRTKQTTRGAVRLYGAWFNWFLRVFFSSPFHDESCSFKAFRRSILEKVRFYPEDFRMFPLAAHRAGLKVAEVEIVERPRVFGRSKFGSFLFLHGVRDILLFIVRYGLFRSKAK